MRAGVSQLTNPTQVENAALHKRAISNVEHVKLAKEARALKGQVETLQAALDEAQARPE